MLRSSTLTRLTSFITTVALIVVQFGCSASTSQLLPTVPVLVKLRTQKVALISLPMDIDFTSDLYARGRTAGGLKGAATGPFEFMVNSNPGNCMANSICGAALLIWVALAVTVGPVIGAVKGAIKATPANETDRLELDVNTSTGLVATNIDLSRQVLEVAQCIPGVHLEQVSLIEPPASATPDYRALRNSGYGAILEIALRDIHLLADEKQGNLLSLYFKASARVIDPETQQTVYEKEFIQITAPADWGKKTGSAVLQALSENIHDLAQEIVSCVFESATLPLSSNYWAFPGTRNFGWCWLNPVYPPNNFPFPSTALHSSIVASPQPTLSFRPFPDEEQAAELYQGLGIGVDVVTYGIRVWQPQADSVPKLVYERHSLSRTSHTLEQPLEYETEYYWSVRACFPYQGISICTPWARSSVPAMGPGVDSCYKTPIPLRNYYRFKTPGGWHR